MVVAGQRQEMGELSQPVQDLNFLVASAQKAFVEMAIPVKILMNVRKAQHASALAAAAKTYGVDIIASVQGIACTYKAKTHA